MKATLEFTLPEEADEHRFALAGEQLYCAIQQHLEDLRRAAKDGRKVDAATLRRMLSDDLIERGLSWIVG